MEWDFGEVQGGMYIISTKSFPYDVAGILQGFDIVATNQMSSDLPEGVQFSIDTSSDRGMLRGTLPRIPTTYHVVYGFVDTNKCTVAVLYVSINVAGGGQQTGTPTTPSGPELSVVVTDVAVEQLCDYDYSHAVTVYYETTGGTEPVSIEGIYWTYPDGSTFVNHGGLTSGWLRTPLDFPNGGQVTVRVVAQDSAGRTASDTGVAYLNPCTSSTVTPRPSTQLCLHVSAVTAAQQMATTYMPQYSEIPVEMTVNGKLKYTTQYDLCGESGSQFFIQTPRDFWTQQEVHLYFQGWQRYDEQNQQWVPLSNDQRVTQNPNIRVTLKNGGSLRAVYQQQGY